MTDGLPRLHPNTVPRYAAYDLDVRDGEDHDFTAFVQLSMALTGFSKAELASTGMAPVYFDELGLTIGVPTRSAFLNAVLDPSALLSSSFHGALARNVIRMWYLGQWKRLSPGWLAQLTPKQRASFDEFGRNVDRVVSAQAYQEGLAWRAIRVNPMGAKQPGFGSWAERPR